MTKANINAKRKMHVKQGDTVKIIAGRERGKIGQVIRVMYATSKVVIKNINIKTKHIQSNQKTNKGSVVKIEMPIHSSNVMLYSNTTKTASRYSNIITKNTKQRILKKTQEII